MPRLPNRGDPHQVEVTCPACQHVNLFAGDSEFAHWGRRCRGIVAGERCTYFWQAKVCEHCGTENDIAARLCRQCGNGLVDYNAKLTLEAIREPQRVTDWSASVTSGTNGKFILARALLEDGRIASVPLNPAKSEAGAKYFYYAWAKPLGFSRQCWQWRKRDGADLTPLAALLHTHRPTQVTVEQEGPYLRITRVGN